MLKFFFVQTYTVEIQVENGSPRGGAVVETLVWMKSLHAHHHEIYQAKLKEDKRKLKDEFNWIKMIPIYNSKKFKKRLVWFTYRFPSLYLALREKKIDFLYTSVPTWHTFYIGIICKLLNIKHIIRIASDINVSFESNDKFNFFDKKLIHFSYKLSNIIVAQNEYQEMILNQKYPKNNIIKLYNPIEIKEKYLKIKKRKEGYIAWVANFRFVKNMKLLYEIASTCPYENFKIAGQPFLPMDEETETHVEKLKTLENVDFVGVIPQSDILKFLSSAKYLLNTSRFEGFSNTFLEAMIVGLPILTTASVNPDGIINKYKLGILYENAQDFHFKITSIIEDDYFQISQNCIDYVSSNHDHLVIGKKLLEVLDAI